MVGRDSDIVALAVLPGCDIGSHDVTASRNRLTESLGTGGGGGAGLAVRLERDVDGYRRPACPGLDATWNVPPWRANALAHADDAQVARCAAAAVQRAADVEAAAVVADRER